MDFLFCQFFHVTLNKLKRNINSVATVIYIIEYCGVPSGTTHTHLVHSYFITFLSIVVVIWPMDISKSYSLLISCTPARLNY